MVSRGVVVGLAIFAATACGGRVSNDDAGNQTQPDGGATADAPWHERFDAPVYEAEPPVGTYPPNGPGPCNVSGCADDYSVCFPNSGWCCGGTGLRGPYPCSCGDAIGCVPPLVCCARRGEGTSQCRPASDC
jgi:hypothetical protein